ncbi:MAG: hypothetical protein ABIA04_07615 [Pseudomonadota bacterium]
MGRRRRRKKDYKQYFYVLIGSIAIASVVAIIDAKKPQNALLSSFSASFISSQLGEDLNEEEKQDLTKQVVSAIKGDDKKLDALIKKYTNN